MKKILNESQTDILKNRVFISRKIKAFTFGQLAEEWKMTKVTISRYDSPKYREMTRLYSKRKTDEEKLKDRKLCQICFLLLKDHARCGLCTRLAHDVIRCKSCGTLIDYTVLH